MKYYTEPSREIPVAAETEVLVVGGGPAGFGAALHAARMGRKTMLIEQYGAVGGVATTGIMSHWTGRQDGGCFEELREKARDCEAEQVINPEKLRILMLDMLVEAGVNVQLYTGFSDVIMEGNRVAGVITESKSGREAILSKMVIDSTGDGDVAARAGVPFEKGRSTDGGMQPMTIMFKVAGVDMDRAMFFWGFEDTVQLPEGDLQTLGRQELPSPAGHILLYPSSLPGVVTVNMSNMTDVDGTNARDLNRAEYVCRKQLPEIIAFLRRHVPGYEGCYLIDSADVIGVRETRRFEANYQLNEQDIALYAVLVALLKERRQVTGSAHGENTFRRTRYPGQYACQYAEHQGDGDNRRSPRDAQIMEVVVEADQQRLGQVDVFGRNDEAQRERAQHEDQHGHQRADDDGFRIVARRILHVHHVNTHHLHTGIEEEDAAGQYQVVEIRQVGEEALRHIHVVMAAGRNVNDAQKNEQTCRYDRTDHTSPFADFADPVHAFQRNECCDPVNSQYDY